MQTYRHGGNGGDQRVDDDRRRLAVVFRSRVWLGISFVEAEEALDVHGERVRVLKVVRQQNGSCHYDQLEIKHSGSSVRDGNPQQRERRSRRRRRAIKKILSRMMMENKKRDVSSTGRHDGCVKWI